MKQKLIGGAAVAGLIAMLVFFYQSAAYSSRSGEDTPLYSVRRHDPYGTAALHDLLVDRGIPVRTLERPALDAADHGILIQVLANSDWSNHLQNAPLIDWISRGNTVLQLSRSSTDLLGFVKVIPTTQPSKSEMKSVQDFEEEGGPPEHTAAAVDVTESAAPGVPQLELWSPMTFSEQPATAWKTLAVLANKKQEVAAGELSIGKGKLIVVGAPTPALNGTLGDAGNLDFLLNIIGNRPVILDEWSHGIGRQRTIVSFLHDVGLLPMLLQVVVVAGLYVWSTSGYAQPIEAGTRRQRSSVEQIETLGFLYSRSLGSDVTFDRVNAEVQRRLSTALRCQPANLAAQLPTIKPALRQKIEQLFSQLNSLRSAQTVRCTKCGFDLSFNESGRCPECGETLHFEQRKKLDESARDSRSQLQATPPSSSSKPRRVYAGLAAILSLSHQLTLEVTRDRRSAR